MANIVVMAVGNGRHQLGEHHSSRLLSEMVLFHYKVKELPTLAELSDNIEIGVILVEFLDFEHVGVVDFSQQVDLVDQLLLLDLGLSLLVDNLDRHFLACHIVNGLSAFSKGTSY